MRLRSQVTLEHYLQEMAGFSVLPSLPAQARDRIRIGANFYKVLERRAIRQRSARYAAAGGTEYAAL